MGDELFGYRVRRVDEVPELSIRAFDLRHESSGAEHLHLARDDSNNSFSVTFRTTPKDSTGVAHILEHLVLCGSERFPCRDPFMKMTQRSLATFLNAFTMPDCTVYPFSSTNAKDFSNLMQVYLDAVFFPKLRYLDFIQEGWRLEHEKLEDRTSKLGLKGVVFNEMKGVFSSSSQLYYRYLLNGLFPDNTYANESGGDPCVIPDLSHQQLSAFFKTHYHPSNARFMTYGSFPLEQHLELISSRVLSRFSVDPDARQVSKVPLQPRWSSPKHLTLECAPDPFAPFPEKQATASVSFLLNEVGDPTESFELSVLAHLLTNGPNSPFYKALIASGLGTDYSPGTGLMDYTRQAGFSVGAMGMTAEDAAKLQDVVSETLVRAASEGFPQERVDACLHLIEIGLKHITANFGLGLVHTLAPVLNHDADPLAYLQTGREIAKFRKKMSTDKDFLKEKIVKLFLQNTHRLFLLMKPADDFMDKVAAKEQTVLDQKVQQLTDESREQVYRQGLELHEFQKRKDDASVLPTLNVATDISRDLDRTDLKHVSIDEVPVQTLELKTNGINYLKLLFQASDLPSELQQFLPLFASVVTRIGAGKRDHRQMDQEVDLRTRGLSCSTLTRDSLTTLDLFDKCLYMSSYCLEQNFEHMIALWRDVLVAPQFGLDKSHLTQLVRMQAADLVDGISYSGHQYAVSAAARNLTPAAGFRERVSGLAFADFMKQQSESSDVDALITRLQQIQQHILHKNRMKVALTTESSALAAAMPLLETLVTSMPSGAALKHEATQSTHSPPGNPVKELHVMNFNSNYVGKAVTAVPFLHPDNASLTIAGQILTSKFLLKEVREIGGAYGARAGLGSGVFTFSSYRDPRTVETLQTFEESAKWLSEGRFVDEDVAEAKLATFQSIDKPVTPAAKGSRFFLTGVTDEQRHEHRMALLAVDRDHVIDVGRTYLLNRTTGVGYSILSSGKETRDGWTVIKH